MENARGSKIYTKITQRLDRVEDGNLGQWKSVGEGICEFVIDFGPGYRIYFGQDGDDVVILLVGDKGAQERNIRTAKEYWTDYNAQED